MAVAFDAQGTTFGFAALATSINFTNLTVGSGANRALVVTLVWSTTLPTGITVKWDNAGTPQTCTLISGASISGAGQSTQCYGLVNPTSGNKTLNVAWTGAHDVFVDAVAYTGVDQTGGATSFPGGTSGSGTNNSPTFNIVSATTDAVVACWGVSLANISTINNTQMYLDNAASSLISSAANRAVGAASVAMTLTPNNTWCAAGTSVAQVGVSTTLGGQTQILMM